MKKLTPAEKELIRNEGFFAYLEGKTSEDNPYNPEDQYLKYDAWYGGWNDADYAEYEFEEEYDEYNYPEIARP